VGEREGRGRRRRHEREVEKLFVHELQSVERGRGSKVYVHKLECVFRGEEGERKSLEQIFER
jgi:hypothetical protein